MKSIFCYLLIALSILSCTYASLFPDFNKLGEEMQKFEQQYMSIASNYKKSRNTFLLDGKLLLMAIEQGKEISELPLLGTYQSKGKCEHTRLFFFDIVSKLFVVSELSCENKVLLIEGLNGQYTINIKDAERLRKKSTSKTSSLISSNYSFTTQTLPLSQISNCPSNLKNFNLNMIPHNFNIETDQQHKKSFDLSHKGFYYTNNRKNEKVDSKNELTYALFNSETLNYAVPIQKGCECTLEESQLLNCECNDFNYEFDVRNSLLIVNEVKLLTTNIRGFKVLTAKSNTELLTLIDIITQEQENEAELETLL